MSYNRYTLFNSNGEIESVPFGKIPVKDSDFYETYQRGKTRLDILSYNYYKDSSYGWLILQANPEYGALEFDIPDGVTLRIPYPLNTSITDYENSIKEYKELYK